MSTPENLKIKVEHLLFAESQGSTFFNPELYVKIRMKDEEFKTKIGYMNGKTPEFNEEFDLGEANHDQIIVQVYDNGMFSDDYIGECIIFMDQLKIGTGCRNGYGILKETRAIGTIFIESFYTAEEKEPVAQEEEKTEEKS